ncbi:MAG: hypothetical protein GY852_00435 [bacterium]|nr:hypothetical protein [bacterium]
MNQRGIHAPQDAPISNGPGRAAFKNKLQKQMQEAIKDSVSMLFRGVRMRKRNPSLPTSMEKYIKSNFPLCFANLEEEKHTKLSDMSGWISSLAIEIIKHDHGLKIFEWTINRAIEIAHQEKGDAMPPAIVFLFEASAKVSSLGKTIDVNEFFGAYTGMPISHLLGTTGAIATAETYPELRKAVNLAHSTTQQLKLSRKGSIINPKF